MASARLKNIGISAYKLRLIIDKVRGKKVIYAENQLRYLKSPASKVILKLLQSVTSNAVNNDLQNKDDLKITKIMADQSTSIRRYRAKARGRAGSFDRPMSHLIIEVDEEGDN